MTGPGHFQAAEMLLDDIDEHQLDSARAEAIAIAQVHATLALAAATALADGTSLSGVAERDEWREAMK